MWQDGAGGLTSPASTSVSGGGWKEGGGGCSANGVGCSSSAASSKSPKSSSSPILKSSKSSPEPSAPSSRLVCACCCCDSPRLSHIDRNHACRCSSSKLDSSSLQHSNNEQDQSPRTTSHSPNPRTHLPSTTSRSSFPGINTRRTSSGRASAIRISLASVPSTSPYAGRSSTLSTTVRGMGVPPGVDGRKLFAWL